jgi:hypothetical protein
MRRQVIGVVALLALLPAAGARGSPDDQNKPDKPGTPAEQYQALVKEFNQAREEYFNAARQAKTAEERRTAQEKLPRPQKYADRFMKVAEEHPQDPVAVDALLWVSLNARGTTPAKKAQDRLFAEHADNPKLGKLLEMLSYFPTEDTRKALRDLAAKSSNKEVQGQAVYYLGKSYRNQMARGQTDDNSDKLKAEAQQTFERVLKDFGPVQVAGSTLGAMAKTQLEALRILETRNEANLQVGKVAPEIESEDIQGTPFKLSDYRGKVVVLDFWGHW